MTDLSQEYSYPLLNPNSSMISVINENENNNYSQQLRETDVAINLVDCIRCYVPIPRCEVIQKEDRIQLKLF
jgi:hypothetical protein